MGRKKTGLIQLGYRVEPELRAVLKPHEVTGPPPGRILDVLILRWKAMSRDQRDALMQELLEWKAVHGEGEAPAGGVNAARAMMQQSKKDFDAQRKRSRGHKGEGAA